MISVSAMLMALLPQISVCKYRTDIKVYRYITREKGYPCMSDEGRRGIPICLMRGEGVSLYV